MERMSYTPRQVEARLRAVLARHLEMFLSEYSKAREAVVVCRTPKPFKLAPRITAVPWQDLPTLADRIA